MQSGEQREPVQPFIVTRLSDVVPVSVLRTIQTGLATQHCIPVAILEPEGEGFRYITPFDSEVNHSPFCLILRSIQEGYQRCQECDYEVCRELMAEGAAAQSRSYRCHMGLVEVALPIVVAERVVAVLLSGQSRLLGTEEEIRQNACRVAAELGGLDAESLCHHVSELPERTEKDIASLIETLEEHVREIARLGQDRYDVERRLRQELLLGELMVEVGRPCADNQELRGRLEGVLARVNDFFRLRWSAMFGQVFTTSPELELIAQAGQAGLGEAPRLRCPDQAGGGAGAQTHVVVTSPAEMVQMLGGAGSPVAEQLAAAQALICDFGGPGERVMVTVFGPQREGHTESLFKTAGDDFLDRFHYEVGMRAKAARLLLDLQQANADKTQFLAQMTHEINAGLQAIVEESEWLEYYAQELARTEDPEILGPLEKIRGEVLRLGARSRSSLLHLRGGMPRSEYKLLRAHSLARLLAACADPYRSVAQARNITIKIEDSIRQLPLVAFDWDMLKLAFMNLIDNAVKYSHFNRTIRIYGEVEGDWVTVAIEDFGMGIPAEEFERIFEPYVRGTQRDPRRFIWGSGLGLAVARDIVRTHGGDIQVKSVPMAKQPVRDPLHAWENYLTTFTVRLPLRQEG